MTRLLPLLVLAACAAPLPIDELWPRDEPLDFDGTAPAAPRAYSGDVCPDVIIEADAFTSSDRPRQVRIELPADPIGAPVLFFFHGLGNNPDAFGDLIDAPGIAADHGMIVVLPKDEGAGNSLAWGTPPNDPEADLTLFDDLLSCLHEQLEVDLTRVYVSGFSAGAMWSSFLVMNRSSHLAAAAIFSGGVEARLPPLPGVVNEYRSPVWPIPVVIAHGGVFDHVFINFQRAAGAFAERLGDDGHTAIRCPHRDGHAMPADVADWGWGFLGAHALDGRVSPFADPDAGGDLPASCLWP